MRTHPFTLPAGMLVAALCARDASAQALALSPVSSFGVPGGVAEIVDATPDGNTLVYTDAGAGELGVVDITNPASQAVLATIPVAGEPTSVSIRGTWAVAAVWADAPSEGSPPPAFTAGKLAVIDLTTPASPLLVGTVDIGWHPDSVKLTEIGGQLVAIVAIENQPVVVENGLVTGDDAPGDPNDVSPAGLIQVVVLNTANPAASTVHDVLLPAATLTAAGCLFAGDPQPEFVAIYGTTVACSLQENNGIAIVDIATPSAPVLVRVFACGTATERLADLDDDDTISFTQGFPSSIGTVLDAGGNPIPAGVRMPDAIVWSADGSVIYSADEGEFNYTGGRGFSAWSVTGAPVWDDAGTLEEYAVLQSHYPDGRSDAKGIEVEGMATAVLGGHAYLYVMSERGSFVAVYDIDVPAQPYLLQIIATGISPEGIVVIGNRDLVVTADEVFGTLTTFQAALGPYSPDPARPTLVSNSVAFAAISGIASPVAGSFLWAIPDNARPTEIYRIDVVQPYADVQLHRSVLKDGLQARYDGEGIVVDDSIIATPITGSGPETKHGFWIASEGNANSQPNLLVQVDCDGYVVREIQLPNSIDAAADPSLGGAAQGPAGGQRIRSNGFEGLTLSHDGRYLLACIQRDFANEFPTGPRYARIARYDLAQILGGSAPQSGLRFGGDWQFFYLELDSNDPVTWAGLSEIVSIGNNEYAVIERDNGIGLGSTLKKVYGFTLTNRTPDADGVPDASDTVLKVLLADLLDEFFPFEKIEGLALTPGGDLWIALDNDGGEVESRLVRVAPLPTITTATLFGTRCHTLVFTAVATNLAPVTNSIEFTLAGYPIGALGMLGLAFSQSTMSLPAPFGCDVLGYVTTIPLPLNPIGSTTFTVGVTFDPGLVMDLQCLTVTAGMFGPENLDTSNGVEIANSF